MGNSPPQACSVTLIIALLLMLSHIQPATAGAPSGDSPDCPASARDVGKATLFFEQVLQRLTCRDCHKVKTSCDLRRLDKIPEIILLGEHHTNRMSVAIKKRMLELAAQGSIPLVSEMQVDSALLPWDALSTHLKGLESPIPYGIVSSYYLQRSLVDGEDPRELLVTTIAPNVRANPLFSKAYEDVREKWRDRCPSCLAAIDQVVQQYAADKNTVISRTVVGNIRGSRADHVGLIRDIHERILKIAAEKYSDRIPVLPPASTKAELEDLGIRKDGSFVHGSRFAELIQSVRDQDFAAGVADNLCHLSRSSSHLVVLVGDAHAERMPSLLRGLGGSRVKIHYVRTYKSNAIQELQTLFSGIRYNGNQ